MLRIAYEITDQEWARSAALRSDPDSEPIFDCFYGSVQLTVDGSKLFATRPLVLSVADFACSLAHRLDEGYLGADSSSAARFRQADDALEIQFLIVGDIVRISSNHGSAKAIETDRAGCRAGMLRFLEDFATQVEGRVVDAFDWKDLRALRRYVSPALL